jgi:hypothetical protein
MEHRSKGQIGQPAACMIENNRALSAVPFGNSQLLFKTRDYDPKQASRNMSDCSVAAMHRPARTDCIGDFASTSTCASTAAVDNFVGNWAALVARARKRKARHRLLKD